MRYDVERECLLVNLMDSSTSLYPIDMLSLRYTFPTIKPPVPPKVEVSVKFCSWLAGQAWIHGFDLMEAADDRACSSYILVRLRRAQRERQRGS